MAPPLEQHAPRGPQQRRRRGDALARADARAPLHHRARLATIELPPAAATCAKLSSARTLGPATTSRCRRRRCLSKRRLLSHFAPPPPPPTQWRANWPPPVRYEQAARHLPCAGEIMRRTQSDKQRLRNKRLLTAARGRGSSRARGRRATRLPPQPASRPPDETSLGAARRPPPQLGRLSQLGRTQAAH